MSSTHSAPGTIDEYIQGFPRDVQGILQRIRIAIAKAAPDAEETISYQIPTFKLKGNLVSFAAYQKHIGLYPAPTGSAMFNKELSDYKAGKSTLRFPLDKPIPYELIIQIVKLRVKENLSRDAERAKKRRA